MSIWSCWPAERIPTEDPSRTVCGMIDAPIGRVLLFGTVLPWNFDKGPSGTASNWVEARREFPRQIAEWCRLRGACPDVPMVVAGDFNIHLARLFDFRSTDERRAYGLNSLREALWAFIDDGWTAPTAERPPALRRPLIDHVLVSRPFGDTARVTEAWEGTIDGVAITDHSGVVVTV